jgi:release factor glutamine methyltransferase
VTALEVPQAYVSGWKGFYRREFAVNEHVLVPRPETEHLIEDALEFMHATGRRRVLDVGTGSGAIACTIAGEVPDAIVTATDVSIRALAVAARNAAHQGVGDRCTFALADIVPADANRYDVIVANLPYIPSADVPQKPDPVGFEPRVATDGGADGLEQYRKLLAAAPRLAGAGALVLMEAAPPTMGGLRALAEEAFPQAAITVHRDYAGLERYVRVATR